jgi:hypothetical protein
MLDFHRKNARKTRRRHFLGEQGAIAVKRLPAMLMVLCVASTALGWPSDSPSSPLQRPHPAVVRVTSLDREGASLGSGVLVAVNPTHGLVLTNWHVVRETRGTILVSFPDGFTSGATVLKTDSTWDLAALAIWRPNVQPVRLSVAASRPGEVLTIAGYGGDSTYRAVSGRCTEYLSPGRGNPNELVEVGDVAARNGDSGGPIFNTRGELAGLLFGSNDSFLAGRYTMGSYCGRVRLFVVSVSSDFQRLPANPTMVARQSRPVAEAAPPAAIAANEPPAPRYSEPTPSAQTPAAVDRQTQPPAEVEYAAAPVAVAGLPQPATVATLPPASSRAEQIKTFLAIIGIFALLFHGIRLIGATVG